MLRSIFRISVIICLVLVSVDALCAQTPEDTASDQLGQFEPAGAIEDPSASGRPSEQGTSRAHPSVPPAAEPLPGATPTGKPSPGPKVSIEPTAGRTIGTGTETSSEFKREFDLSDLRKSWNESARFGYPARLPASDDTDDPGGSSAAAMPQRFHWKPAIYQSLMAQGFQHAYALAIQKKTQRALRGPFFRDYWESIKGVRGWDDGNRFFTNYIAHPMQGAMTGFIYLQNHDRLKRQKFNESPQYWKDRFNAFLWSTAWSTNWEIGPISQASLGNVGMYGHGGWVDIVITPTVGTGWMISEEALDRYIIRHWEDKNLATRITLRTFLNPMRSVANVLRFKKPWYRDRAY